MISRNFVTAHSHPQSLDSGSKPEAFAKREVELGSGAITCTDHGTLSAVYDCYKLGKEHGLIAVPGLEAYFRDDDCPLLKKIGVPRTDTVPRGSDKEAWRAAHPEGSYIDYLKYYHLTLHFQDYPAYLCAVKLLSKADLRAEQHGSEKKPLFDWSDIEELAAHNVTASSSCLVGMVSRHLIRAEPGSPRVAAATAYFERLRHLFGQRFYVGLFPHVCTHDWVNLVSVTVVKDGGGTEELRFGPDKLVRTNLRECRANEWAKNFPSWGDKLIGVSHYRKWHDEPVARQVVSVEHKEGFYQNECRPSAPGGDVQWGCNKFALSMADKYKLPILIEDDSHFAHPEEHVVQTVRLAQHGGNFRFHHSYHRRSNAEIYEYFRTRMDVPEARIDEWVETSHAWAEGFKGFKFDSSPKLPSNFFPADSLAYTRELVTRHGREVVDPVYRQRLETEIELLHRNGKVDLLPYFQLLEECCRVVSNQGDLPGIGRGSAGGSLLAYYLEITHLDPIEHGLSFERFLTLDRVKSGKLPDIDQDLARRDWLLGFDTHVIEFEAEDGTRHIVPEQFRVDTDQGLATIQEALAGGGRILYPWWLREPAPARVVGIVRSSRDAESPLPARYDGYLRMRFPRCVAQVSTTTTMKLKAAIRDVARLFHRKCDRCYAEYGDGADRCPTCDVYMRGYVPDDTEEWVKRMEEPPQNVDDLEFCIGYERDDTGHVPGSIETDTSLQAYVEAYPQEWGATQRAMGLPRSAGRHPCAFIIADRPIEDFIPLRTVGGERVTQLTAEGVEAVGGLKVDFLRVNSLGDVEVAVRLVQERHGGVPPTQVLNGRRVLSQRLVPLAGALYDVWALPDDPAVYADICRGETEGVFQVNTGGAQRWLTCTNFADPRKEGARLISTLADLAVFTALDRPGPLDYKVKAPVGNEEHNVLVEYYHRARGLEPSKTIPAAVGRLLPETHGVIVYQEQVQKIYQFVTECSLVEAEKFRQDVAKKLPEKIEAAYQKFMERGTEKLGAEDAQTIWDSLVVFSAYGFNKAHATAYGATAYACAWLKHHYPLEWWTAVLRNASAKGEKEEIAHTFWPHIQDIVEMPDIRTTSETWEIVGDKIRAPASILKGLGDVAHAQLVRYAPYTDLLDFVSKMKHHQETNPTTEGKPGRNALHSSMVYSLIVSGVLDAFFPPDSTVHNALALYDTAAREVWGKKKKPIAGEYTVPDAVGRYQIRKGVLEIYNSDLRPLLYSAGLPACLTFDGKRMRYHAKEWSRDARKEVDTTDLVVGGRRLEELLEAEPTGGGWRCAAVAYVESAERFKRGKMKDPAWDLILEVGGAKIRVRHWSRHDGTLPDLAVGAVIATVLTRTDPKYGFNASSLTMLREPMPAKIKVEKKAKGEKDAEARNEPDREAAGEPD